MEREKRDVDAAYALKTPDDNRRVYAGWAKTYDEDFAARMKFLMPGHVAQLFADLGGTGPVLDAGAGTGLVGQALSRHQAVIVDALDLSPEMLRVAQQKGVYRAVIEANLLETLPIEDASYNAVLSSGTFTHGHVGPEALDELLRIAAPGALFVLTIKLEHYEERGFAAKFASFGTRITGFQTEMRAIYGDGAAGDHGEDQGLISTFWRA